MQQPKRFHRQRCTWSPCSQQDSKIYAHLVHLQMRRALTKRVASILLIENQALLLICLRSLHVEETTQAGEEERHPHNANEQSSHDVGCDGKSILPLHQCHLLQTRSWHL